MKVSRMSVFVAGLMAALLISGPVFAGGLQKTISKNPEAQKLIDQAWNLEHLDNTAKIFKDCTGWLEQADKLDPDNYLILIDLSRYWWNYGDNLPKQTKEQQKFLEEIYGKGMTYAGKSLALKETSAGHYWFAVNKSSSLEFSSIFAQAAGFPSIKKNADYVTDHDSKYYYGATGRLWSEIMVRVPKIVVEMVHWNVQDAIDQINDAIKEYPGYLDNYAYKARFYFNYFEDKDTAIKLLEFALGQDANTVMHTEITPNKVAQREGRELWKKITGKEYPNK